MREYGRPSPRSGFKPGSSKTTFNAELAERAAKLFETHSATSTASEFDVVSVASSGRGYRGDDVFFGGHSDQTLPAVASIGIGPSSENPGTKPAVCGRGGGGGW